MGYPCKYGVEVARLVICISLSSDRRILSILMIFAEYKAKSTRSFTGRFALERFGKRFVEARVNTHGRTKRRHGCTSARRRRCACLKHIGSFRSRHIAKDWRKEQRGAVSSAL